MVDSGLPLNRRYEHRFVVLGASNVRRARVPLAKIFLENFSGPVDVVLVGGHGRSFVKTSRVMGWQLPAICDSKWSEHIRLSSAHRTSVVVTDVGNDLFYGRSVPRILGCVELAVRQIGTIDQGLIVGPPMERLQSLRPSQFLSLRSMFFPRSSLTYSEAMQGAAALAFGLEQIAKSHGFFHVQPGAEWYGWDPIHVRWSQRETFWKTIFGNHFIEPSLGNKSGNQSGTRPVRLGLREKGRLFLSRSHTQRWLSFNRGAPQPWLRRPDGSTISFY